MRQINFHDLHIFTADNPRPKVGSAPIIVVLADSSSLNTDGTTGKQRTAIAYIGPLTEFHQQYIPHMARLFSREEALHENQRLREADFHRYLNAQIERTLPLSPRTLKSRGIYTYAWGEEDAQSLDATKRGTLTDDGAGIEMLYSYPLDSTNDMQRMVAEALTLKDQAKDAGIRKTLWIGRPISTANEKVKHRAA